MVSYTTRMPIGFPGRISRSDSLTVEAVPVSQATPPTAYGQFVKLVAGVLQPLASADTAAVIYGLLVNPYPAQSSSNGFGAAVPPAGGIADVLRRGYIVVPLAGGTAVHGEPVYVVTTAAAGYPVGSIVPASNTGGATAVATLATFEGPADASGNVEIAYNI